MVTNISQGEITRIKDTYVTDDTVFVNYFEQKQPSIWQKDGQFQLSMGLPLFSEFYNGEVTAKGLISLIKNNPFIEINKKRFGRKRFDLTKEINLIFDDYVLEIDSQVTIDNLDDSEKRRLQEVYGIEV